MYQKIVVSAHNRWSTLPNLTSCAMGFLEFNALNGDEWGLSLSHLGRPVFFQVIGKAMLGLGASHGIEKHPIVEIAAT